MSAVEKFEPEEDEILEELEQVEETEPLPKPDAAEPSPEEPPAKKSRRLPPLLRLTRRTNIFLSLTLTATILFFMTGNKQTFLDSNLTLILQIIAYTAISLSFFSFVGLLECIFYFIKNRKFRFIIHLISYAIIFAASITISVLSLTVKLLSEGFSF